MTQFIVGLVAKILSYLDLAKVIVTIIQGLQKPVTDFIDAAMNAWDEIIGAAKSAEEAEELKIAAHADVTAKTLAEFSASPSKVEKWSVEAYIKAKVRVNKGGDGKTPAAVEAGIFKQPDNVDDYVQHMRDIGLG